MMLEYSSSLVSYTKLSPKNSGQLTREPGVYGWEKEGTA